MPRYWEMLEEEMAATGEFSEARLKHSLLQRTHYAGRSVVRPETHNCVPRAPIWAHAARLKSKHPQWEELAMFYVKPEHTGNGVLREMVCELFACAPADIKYFGLTKTAPAMRVFLRHGLVPITKAIFPDLDGFGKMLGLGTRPNPRVPETALSDEFPDLGRILEEAKNPATAKRWLFVEEKAIPRE